MEGSDSFASLTDLRSFPVLEQTVRYFARLSPHSFWAIWMVPITKSVANSTGPLPFNWTIFSELSILDPFIGYKLSRFSDSLSEFRWQERLKHSRRKLCAIGTKRLGFLRETSLGGRSFLVYVEHRINRRQRVFSFALTAVSP
jgi:hypothetical protein